MPSFTVDTTGVDLRSALTPLAVLPNDPTVHLGNGTFARATLTPDGPGSVVATWAPGGERATVETFGPGAAWLQERLPGLLGCLDDVTGFHPSAAPLRDLWRRHRRDRIGRTGTIWHDLAWFIVQQRVRRQDAAVQWRRLVAALGLPAPGPVDLLLPPEPAAVARLAYHDLHRFGIERQRADHLLHVARAVRQLERLVDHDVEHALPALQSVRGIGPWTASCVATHTWGSADTVIRGDAGIPSLAAWLLAGQRRATDAQMLELLEPYRGHRYRVIRLAFLSGSRPPRRQPGAPTNDIRCR